MAEILKRVGGRHSEHEISKQEEGAEEEQTEEAIEFVPAPVVALVPAPSASASASASASLRVKQQKRRRTQAATNAQAQVAAPPKPTYGMQCEGILSSGERCPVFHSCKGAGALTKTVGSKFEALASPDVDGRVWYRCSFSTKDGRFLCDGCRR